MKTVRENIRDSLRESSKRNLTRHYDTVLLDQLEALLTEHKQIKEFLEEHVPKVIIPDPPTLPPDEKELVKLINHMFPRKFVNEREAIVSTIMSWAKGEKKREWCSHWKWVDNRDQWNFTGPDFYRISPNSDWDICPVAGCHEPRPS